MRALTLLFAAPFFSVLAVAPSRTALQDQPSPTRAVFHVPSSDYDLFVYLWDDSRSELILSRIVQRAERPGGPLVQIYNAVSGETRSINLLQRFPGAKFITVQALAVGPAGSLVLACEIDHFTQTGDRLLLFDNQAALIRDFPASDYTLDAVALDADGNIYTLGTRDSEVSPKESYPLIVKYDSFGHITGEMLPRSLFSEEDSPTDDGQLANGVITGTPLLAVKQDSVHVYLPKVGEMLVLTQDGQIQSRVNVVSRLSEFTESIDLHPLTAHLFTVDSDAFSPSGDLWLYGRLFVHVEPLSNPPSSMQTRLPPREFAVHINPDGQLRAPYEHLSNGPARPYLTYLIGFTPSNEPIAWHPDPDGNILVIQSPY